MEFIPQTELAYLAGFFDGEGTIGVYRLRPNSAGNKFSFSVSAAGVNPLPLLKLRGYFGGSLVSLNQEKRLGKKIFWQWKICCKEAEFFLRSVLDYLIIKKEEAILALAFRDIRRQKTIPMAKSDVIEKEIIAKKIKELKKQEWAILPQ